MHLKLEKRYEKIKEKVRNRDNQGKKRKKKEIIANTQHQNKINMAAATTPLKSCPLYMCCNMMCIKRDGIKLCSYSCHADFLDSPKGIPVKMYKWQLLLFFNP